MNIVLLNWIGVNEWTGLENMQSNKKQKPLKSGEGFWKP